MCWNPELKNDLTASLADTKTKLEAALTVARQYAYEDRAGAEARGIVSELMSTERTLKESINAIPHKFEVGQGAHQSFNGDRYPYKVVSVSKSGKTVKMVRMGHKAAEKGLPMGHQDWTVYDLPEDQQGDEITVTFRTKTGQWAAKGSSSTSGGWCFHPGAIYSYNWSF